MHKLKNRITGVFLLLVKYSLYYLSFLFPRKKKKWVFGNYIVNAFSDNPKYLFMYITEHVGEVKAIWITRDERIYAHLKSIGARVYKKGSIKGIYHCLTAGVYFYNSYAEDVNFFTSGGALLVNLWHGVGLKKIEFNIERGILAPIYRDKSISFRLAKPWIYQRPSFLVSSTEFQSVPFAKAFRIPLHRCLNLGYPRNDFLLLEEAERLRLVKKYERAETMKFIESIKHFNRVYIYMPTWRDSMDFIRDTKINFAELNEILGQSNSLPILKLHVNTPGIDELEGLSNIILIHGYIDVYSILPYTHMLITDYSSVLYDYILMPGKDVVLYLYDYDQYVNDRDFNYPFLPNVTGSIVKTPEEFYNIFNTNEIPEIVNDTQEVRERFWGNYNGHACKRIVQRILQHPG